MKHTSRTYTNESGEEVVFTTDDFQKVINSKIKKDRITKSNLFIEIEDNCHVSTSSLNHWYAGDNCPNDYDKAITVEKYISEGSFLTKAKNKEEKEALHIMENSIIKVQSVNNDILLECICNKDTSKAKSILYNSLLDLIYQISITHGFTNFDTSDYDNKTVETIIPSLKCMVRKCRPILSKDFYNNLYNFVNIYLDNMFPIDTNIFYTVTNTGIIKTIDPEDNDLQMDFITYDEYCHQKDFNPYDYNSEDAYIYFLEEYTYNIVYNIFE